ncbi:TIGR03751 family conjugal transfer lipoprotein [Pseudomonas sp. NFACC45]|uniref:TIGR03751 family conjugal transfer lipoprotein n=1 Tax=Pseudomonas sp. NFACC45 TaxID=1566201 RepID=UPI0008E17A97|nr:TIGR03751 family conjugal transfer lipoprotein [Pseudomonas sp. NFACC45]SFH38657.1 conjugative transfer region lipoprotein, TIGR03751 family [Pseudomonas sp. NFACC45]
MTPRTWIEAMAAALAVIALTGCATNTQDLLSHDGSTMLEVWNRQTTGSRNGQSSQRLLEARQALRRPLTEPLVSSFSAPYTRTAQNEIQRQFHRLPNPDLVMYVFPHRAGTEAVPVPGYSTVFPLHQRVQYALPGERLEDY